MEICLILNWLHGWLSLHCLGYREKPQNRTYNSPDMVRDPPTSDKTLIWSPSTKLKNQCYSFVEALPVLFTNWNPAKLETPKRDSGSWDLRSDQNNWLVKNMNFALGQDLDFSRITHMMNSFMTESTTQMYNFGKNNPNNALIRPGGIPFIR